MKSWSLAKSATVSGILPFVLFALLILWVIVPAAYGESISSDGFSGSVQTGGGTFGGPHWSSSAWSDSSGQVSGSWGINISPKTNSFEYAQWNFYTDWRDSSRWTASCYINGDSSSSESWPDVKTWSQKVITKEVSISMYLSKDVDKYSWMTDPFMQLNGSVYVTSSELDSSNFLFEEYQKANYDWEKGNPEPIITYTPAWRGTYNLYGHFAADTPEAARAMGAQFVQSVPEPSTWALLISGASAAGIAVWRRRKKA
jgi:hypothetical protein